MSSTPLTRTQARYVKQLKIKKYRLQAQAFLVEGEKSVQDLLTSHYTIQMVATPDFLQTKPVEVLQKSKVPQKNTKYIPLM